MWGGNVNVSLETLITNVSRYNISGINKIKKAYEYAKLKHAGQYRESGEEYITHPLAVAIILARLNADTDTICAGLLHDVIEDTNATKEDIAAEFGESVAILVMGVTNLTKMSISDKNSLNNANLRKLILGMTKDVRILIIKLADRLHNMMTLQYKKNPEKQQRKSLETFDIYVPIAENLGLYSVKNDLEDKCFMFLMPDKYYKVEEERKSIEESTCKMVQEVITKINDILTDNNIPNTVKFRLKNIYGIFKSLFSNDSLEDIHDLLAFKIILDDIDLPVGTLRYKAHGSGGTHNGLRNCVELVGTENFARIRIGVGKPNVPLTDFVLSNIPKETFEVLFNVILQARDKVLDMIKNKHTFQI